MKKNAKNKNPSQFLVNGVHKLNPAYRLYPNSGSYFRKKSVPARYYPAKYMLQKYEFYVLFLYPSKNGVKSRVSAGNGFDDDAQNLLENFELRGHPSEK